MADNTTLDSGAGGDTIATDDIAGVKFPRGKIVIGADGVNDGDVSSANPLPVAGTGTAGTANAGVMTVQGVASMTPVQVGDNSGSLTVDAPVGTPVFVRLSDGAAAVGPALEAGGNLAAAATSLAIIDDWDETDRAKVNPIVGQAGVAAGAGAVGATVQRVTLASDDPGVASLGVMDDWDNAASDGASVSGDVAHDSADAGEPVKVGAKATTALSAVTLVANNDRTNLHAGVDGVQITRPHCGLEDVVTGNANNTDGTSTQCIAASGDAAIKTYLTSVVLTNTSSSNIYVELKSGTTVMATIPLPANGGAIFNPPVPLKPNAANEAWNFDPSAATSTVYCSMIGFKSKV